MRDVVEELIRESNNTSGIRTVRETESRLDARFQWYPNQIVDIIAQFLADPETNELERETALSYGDSVFHGWVVLEEDTFQLVVNDSQIGADDSGFVWLLNGTRVDIVIEGGTDDFQMERLIHNRERQRWLEFRADNQS